MKFAWLLLAISTSAWSQSLNLTEESPRFIPDTAAQTDEFPRPDAIVPAVNFWKRVYGELGKNQIIFSDYDDLALVYRVITLSGDNKTRNQAIKKAHHEIVAALKELDACDPDSIDEVSGVAKEIYENLKSSSREDKYKHWNNIRSQYGLRDHFAEGVKRSGAHDKEIRARLRAADLPEELIGIVFVESLFHPKSRSSVGATGIWQFMRRTAFEFMRVNRLVDERLDPIVSTDAAIRYIKSAKKQLKEWPLVITSYNYGRGGMAKAAEMVGSTDFGDILKNYQNPRFGFAARNYYAEFLAAVDIYKQADELFPDTEPVSGWAYEIIQLPKTVSMRDLLSTQAVEAVWLKTYNPALTKHAHKGNELLPKGFTLRVPAEQKDLLERKLAHLPDRKIKKRRGKTCNFTELPEPATVQD